jgi:hypothetical protein
MNLMSLLLLINKQKLEQMARGATKASGQKKSATKAKAPSIPNWLISNRS